MRGEKPEREGEEGGEGVDEEVLVVVAVMEEE